MKRRIIITILFVISLFIYSTFKMNQDDPKVLSPLLTQVENYIPQRDKINTDVSKVDVAWQLDHILKTINRITEALKTSKPDDYKSSINAARIFTLTGGYIPRGRAQSPDVVKPPEVILTKDLYSQLEQAKKNISKLKELEDKTNFEHPYFGQLNKSHTIRFLEVHTKHHRKIVKDIVKE